MIEADAEDLYEMANLRPKTTGLPMVIWVSERGNAQHDARIKVSMQSGNRMNIHNTSVVGIRPPSVLAGFLSSVDQQAVFRWININETALIDYWNQVIDTAELIQRLRPLPTP
jgi:hypothetical protein